MQLANLWLFLFGGGQPAPQPTVTVDSILFTEEYLYALRFRSEVLVTAGFTDQRFYGASFTAETLRPVEG